MFDLNNEIKNEIGNLTNEDLKNIESILNILVLDDDTNLTKTKWRTQFIEAMSLKGGNTSNIKPFDFIMHFLSFFWKVS